MKLMTRILLMLLLSTLPISVLQAADKSEDSFAKALSGLASFNINDRAKAVTALGEMEDPRLTTVFKALLSGDLYYRKTDKQIGILFKHKDNSKAKLILSGDTVKVASHFAWHKIIINNRMRGDVRTKLATIQLSNKSAKVRTQAVKQILDELDTNERPVIQQRLAIEKNKDVRALLKVTLAALTLKAGDSKNKLADIKTISNSLSNSVHQVLSQVASNDSDAKVKAAAATAIKHIDSRAAMYSKLETLFFGISLGSVLVLAAIGLAITFGVMGVINMAHGELIMLGAYTTYVVQLWLPNMIEYSVIIAIPLAFLVSGAVGILIERTIIRFLYGRPLETLLATFGVSLVLRQLVRSIFGPLNRAVDTPQWMSGAWQINDAFSLTWNRLYIVIFSLIVFVLLFLVLKKTRLGLMVRAVSQNRAMARAMGIRANWVDAMTFGLGSGVAGVAGVALSQLTNVGPNLGQSYIIDSFMVVVFGGVGNLWGTLVAGLGLGVVNKIMEPWAGAVLAKILVLVFIILFIQKRPRGLFPQKGRAADN